MRFQKIPPKRSVASHIVVATSGDNDAGSTEPAKTSTQPSARVLPQYLLLATKPRTEGANVLDSFGLQAAKVNGNQLSLYNKT